MKLMKRRNMVAPRTQPHPLREARINSQTTQYGERPYLYTNIEDMYYSQLETCLFFGGSTDYTPTICVKRQDHLSLT